MTGFDCTAARRMLDVLANARQHGLLCTRDLELALDTPGYRLFMDHHNRFAPGSFTADRFRAMLAAAVSGDKSYDAPQPRLARMLAAFSGAMTRLDELQSRLAEVEEPGCQERAAALALRWLPEGADLTAEVHFLLDGSSGGYVLGKRIGMDLLQYNGQLEALEGVIAHELHHVGFASVGAPAADQGQSAEGGAVGDGGLDGGMEVRLAGLFLGEGSATALVYGQPRPGDEWYEEWAEHERSMADHFAMTRGYLARIAAGEVSAEDFERDVPAMYLRGRWGVGYAIGAVMVRTVLKGLGEERLLSCMRHPGMFLETYRQAVAALRAAGTDAPLHEL
ncbi:MAG: DUF5700 domain-containing putative Zn-dependent protease [Bacillota bacterium]|nr:DUF5700 domain-containing putative Zn-dependent protease [Bacillota bacterium]